MVQNVAVDAHVVHEFGDFGALFGEHHFTGCVIPSKDGVAQLTTTRHGLSGLDIDVLTSPTGGTQCSGASV